MEKDPFRVSCQKKPGSKKQIISKTSSEKKAESLARYVSRANKSICHVVHGKRPHATKIGVYRNGLEIYSMYT